MTPEERTLFYIGGALYLDLEQEQIDAILNEHGLSTAKDSVRDCREAVKRTHPGRYEAGKKMRPYGA